MTGDAGWWPRAACSGADTERWFPSGEVIPADVADICGACPVRQDCLEYALADSELKGIWAGTSPKVRARLRRRAS